MFTLEVEITVVNESVINQESALKTLITNRWWFNLQTLLLPYCRVFISLLHDHAKNHISEIRVALYDADKAIIEINFAEVGDRNFIKVRTTQKGRLLPWLLAANLIPIPVWIYLLHSFKMGLKLKINKIYTILRQPLEKVNC